MKKIFSAALALVCVWFATPALAANCNLTQRIINKTYTGVGSSVSDDHALISDITYKENTPYTITIDVEPSNITFSEVGNLLWWSIKYTDGSFDYTGVTSYNYNNGRVSVTTAANKTVFSITGLSNHQRWTGGTLKVSNLQIEEGTTATAYQPYHPLCATCDGTVVSGQWNQLVQNGNFADGVNNWIVETSVVANAENGVLSVTYQNGGDRGVGQVVEIGSGHKVFVSFDVDSYTGESYIGVFRGGNSASMFRSLGDAVKINRTGHYEQVKTLTALSSGFDYYAAGAGRPVGGGVTVSFSNLNVIDLTEMFGAGNEPSTEQEAKAAIAQRANELGISATNGYYAYHANENISSCISKIKIATTKYNETKFSPLNTALQNAISVVDTVVSNTITQAASIATLQTQKQTRPDETCPAGKKCLLVEDASGVPHWYEICSSAHCLPEGYTELEYIESTGTQYIDTGISSSDGNDTIRINIDIQSMETDESNHYAFGRFSNGANYVYDAGGVWGNGVAKSRTPSRQKTNIDAIFKPLTLNMVFNGSDVLNRSDGYISPNKVFRLGAVEGNVSASVRMWDTKIWKNDALVRDFIPAKNADGKIGMYDLANGVFYENAGTGEFVAGDPVSE